MIIKSLLDTDLYKLTMQQAVLHQFAEAEVEYTFKCRNREDADLGDCGSDILIQIDNLAELHLTNAEYKYLKTLQFFKSDYLDFLKTFKFNPDYIDMQVEGTPTGNFLNLTIRGPWLQTILFEVPLLAIINETFFQDNPASREDGKARLSDKINYLKRQRIYNTDFFFADFGTRRRYSFAWQNYVIQELIREVSDMFVGTSNLYFAMQYNIKPIGTMAHEFIQAAQALGPKVQDSQKFAFQAWANEYRGDLGIALSDTLGMKTFIKDFDMYFAKLFDGVRHDSGDPYKWCDSLLKLYAQYNIDARTKTAVFSDGLTIPAAIAIAQEYHGKIKTSFGIGTNLTNDFDHEALQIVMKMTKCDGFPVAKLSDSPGKQMCQDAKYLAYLKRVLK